MSKLHPRNLHSGRYDLRALSKTHPALKGFLKKNPKGEDTIDFANSTAVKTLNAALLKHYYQIAFWDIPQNFLCPPIPGRADYIHYLADLLASSNSNVIPQGKSIKGLDIGTGANVIYPLLAHKSYGWKITGSDIDKTSLASADAIIKANGLTQDIRLVKQNNRDHIFKGVITNSDHYHFTLCNPPFHASAQEAAEGSNRKIKNLGKPSKKSTHIRPSHDKHAPALNFGGQHNELWCEGGELAFIKQMIRESADFKDQCLWFTTLVAKQEHLPAIFRTLKKAKVAFYKEVKMAQGNKISRFVAWTFHTRDQQGQWFS